MSSNPQTAQPVRILLVEDDHHIGRIIELAMQGIGIPYEFVSVLSAEEALERWKEQPFDFLISDYNLRGMNGVRLVKTLREQGYNPITLIVTAYDSSEVRHAVAEADVHSYMTKPFFIDELIERIKQLLSTNWSMKERMLNA
ncbi:response regulator [Chloroflexus sp. MS-CIW-1]|jgi:DNA-binding response OmpR family regulator|uniref:response regulator n=1 Tax=unclassified Chloroflexus TaxID=2633855 RepID=UPI0004DF9BFB|nr:MULTISPECIES: response regulator [unclassified Chloroflexus]MDN5270416.1 response regulator [Chloroflexus sp. MS-CIW-1]